MVLLRRLGSAKWMTKLEFLVDADEDLVGWNFRPLEGGPEAIEDDVNERGDACSTIWSTEQDKRWPSSGEVVVDGGRSFVEDLAI